MKKILIVGINNVTLKYISKALKMGEVEPILSLDYLALSDSSKSCIAGIKCIPFFGDQKALSGYLQSHEEVAKEISSITTFFDELFPMISEVALEFGYNSAPSIYAKLASKSFVGSLIPEHVPFESRIVLSDDQITIPWIEKDKINDVMIKPEIGSGALATTRVSIYPGESAVEVISSAILNFDIESPLKTPWIVQKYCEGELLSLEGFVERGEINFLGLSKRTRVGLTETSNAFPANSKVDISIRRKMAKAVNDLVIRSGFDNGFFHCEFIATNSTAYLIDANMGRLGGASVIEQISLAHNLEPEKLLLHASLLPLGMINKHLEYEEIDKCNDTLAYWYCIDEEAKILGWNMPSLSAKHTSMAKIGSIVAPIGISDHSWVGILCGYEEVVKEEISQITINTDKGQKSPVFT